MWLPREDNAGPVGIWCWPPRGWFAGSNTPSWRLRERLLCRSGVRLFYGCFLVIEAHGGTWFRTPCPIVVRSRRAGRTANLCRSSREESCFQGMRVNIPRIAVGVVAGRNCLQGDRSVCRSTVVRIFICVTCPAMQVSTCVFGKTRLF